MAWGCRQLLASKTIHDAKKGTQVRAKLQAIYNMHMIDRPCVHWSQELLDSVRELLDINKEGAAPSTPLAAASSSMAPLEEKGGGFFGSAWLQEAGSPGARVVTRSRTRCSHSDANGTGAACSRDHLQMCHHSCRALPLGVARAIRSHCSR